jgi:DNA end-binding protein Ku
MGRVRGGFRAAAPAEGRLMASRPIWSGHLRLALVSCPVALHATHHESANLHFHFINPETGHRVQMLTVDADNKRPVQRRDLVRGFEFKKDHYLILSDEDFEQARIESSSTLVIHKFVPREELSAVYYDASYYLAPDGKQGADVFAVLRDAIAGTGRMALSRVVLSRRERAVAIAPMGRGLVAHTLFEERDIYDPAALWADVPSGKPDAEMVQLATQLIDRQTGTYAAEDSEDRYEQRLREVIEAKLKGEGLTTEPEPEPDRSNVVDLMAALKQSLASAKSSVGTPEDPKKGSKKSAEKPAPEKPAAKRKPAGTRRAG